MKKKIDIQEYIDSGILELYALGMTNDVQNVEIAETLQGHPALQKHLSEIENSLELFAKQYAKQVPAYLKENVLQKIQAEKNLLTQKGTSGKNIYKAISLLTGAALIVFGFFLYNTIIAHQSEKQLHINAYQELQTKHIADSIAIIECKNQLSDLQNKQQYRILLKGTPKSPQSIAAIYYDTTSRKIFLDVLDLPAVPIDKQYQLWAIVNDKPVDLGVFDLFNNKTAFKEIPFVANAKAFAITLEPYGGQASPSMEQMFVIGGI